MHVKSLAILGFVLLASAATPSHADPAPAASSGGLRIIHETPPVIGIRGITKDDDGGATTTSGGGSTTTAANRQSSTTADPTAATATAATAAAAASRVTP